MPFYEFQSVGPFRGIEMFANNCYSLKVGKLSEDTINEKADRPRRVLCWARVPPIIWRISDTSSVAGVAQVFYNVSPERAKSRLIVRQLRQCALALISRLIGQLVRLVFELLKQSDWRHVDMPHHVTSGAMTSTCRGLYHGFCAGRFWVEFIYSSYTTSDGTK